ncbi:SEA (Seh1-associated) complex subunit [Savitreella phatthalungensis]
MTDRTASVNTRQPSVSFSRYARGLLARPATVVDSAASSLTHFAHNGRHATESISDGQRTPTTPGAGIAIAKLRHDAGAALNAFSASSTSAHVAIAGRELLKILDVGANQVAEICDLRDMTEGRKQQTTSTTNDVRWGLGPTSGLLATAHSNGTVVTWDVERLSTNVTRRSTISGHGRAINRLVFNPGNGSWLLTASQDGNMRLWDLRERASAARFSLVGRAEAVRDVQFNAANALELAAVFDNGMLQRWDLRRPNSFDAKVNAHNGPALTVDWHADGRHIATGGRDKVIKLWDSKGELRRPIHYICTMAPVSRVAWRAGDSRQHWDIASCSLSLDNTINIWNLRRPYIPNRVIEDHDGPVTGLLWRDEETLWSCSKDRSFQQHALSLESQPIDAIAHSALDWSLDGELAVAIGSAVSDKYRQRQVAAMLHDEPRRSRDNLVDVQIPSNFEPLAQPFRPVQMQAVVAPMDHEREVFHFMAANYRIEGETACAHNAQVALECGRAHTARCWRLLSLALAQRKRHISARVDPTKPAVVAKATILSAAPTLRPNTPTLIMPRYQVPSRPPSATKRQSHAPSSDSSSDADSAKSPTQTLRRDSSLSSVADSNSYGSYYGVNTWDDVISSPENDLVMPVQSSPLIESALTVKHDKAPEGPQELDRAGTSSTHRVSPWDVGQLFQRFYSHFRDVCDPQTASVMWLVLKDILDVNTISTSARDQVLHAYADMLHRAKLYVAAAELVSVSDSESLQSRFGGDLAIQLTCRHCNKATVQAEGYWHCPRCQSSVICVVCETVVRGEATYCLRCTLAAHSRCRIQIGDCLCD